MVEGQEKAAIDKGMRVIWLIWAGMFTSLLIYVLVCHLLSGWVQIVRDEAWSDSSVQLLRHVLYGVSAFTLVISFYLKRIFLNVRPRTHKTLIVKKPSHLNQPPYVSQYNVTVIIVLALSETIGIYGLYLFFSKVFFPY